MAAIGDGRRARLTRVSRRGTPLPERLQRRPEDSRRELSGESAAAHERAVVTVKLTLLLVTLGIILFFFTGAGSAQPELRRRGERIERFKPF